MKKLALILALTCVIPMAVTASAKTTSSSAKTTSSSGNDLAVGDPMGSDGTIHHTHKHHKKAATSTSTSGAPAEKAPAKAAEPAK